MCQVLKYSCFTKSNHGYRGRVMPECLHVVNSTPSPHQLMCIPMISLVVSSLPGGVNFIFVHIKVFTKNL